MLDDGYYAPSVHATYYSSFLYVKYVLNSICGFLYKAPEPKEGKLSHDALFDKLYKFFPKPTGLEANNQLRCYLRSKTQLKKSRKMADYTPDAIDKKHAELSLADSSSFKDAIDNLLNITL